MGNKVTHIQSNFFGYSPKQQAIISQVAADVEVDELYLIQEMRKELQENRKQWEHTNQFSDLVNHVAKKWREDEIDEPMEEE